MTRSSLSHFFKYFIHVTFVASALATGCEDSDSDPGGGDGSKTASDAGNDRSDAAGTHADGSALDASDTSDTSVENDAGQPDAGLFPHCTGRELNIVAHTDDDLLFLSPDILRAIRAGHCVTTMYATAGDADHGLDYVRSRELGVRAAYAYMAGQPDEWIPVDHVSRRRMLRAFDLAGPVHVRLIFVGVPDALMNIRYGSPSVQTLYDGTSSTITSVDGQNTFTREQYLEVFREQMALFDPQVVRTGDPDVHGDDHPDHRYTALFAREAHQAHAAPHDYVMYRGYNIGTEPENLVPEEFAAKWQAFLLYSAHDPYFCGDGGGTECLPMYESWARRQYSFQ